MAPLLTDRAEIPNFIGTRGFKKYTDCGYCCFEERMVMEHCDDVGVVVFTSQAWGRLFDTRGPLVWIKKTFELEEDYFGIGKTYQEEMSPWSQAPKKVTVTDLFYLRGLDVGSVNIPYLLARYLRRLAAGRTSGAHISGGQFVARLAEHFGEVDDTWAWVAMVLERQPDAMVGAPRVAQDTLAVDEGGQAVSEPYSAPDQPPPLQLPG
ncbi:hypothetical protein Tco_0976170 [Tanacetum coccineum]|uniref:Uncharacterized protein n=1 Tax=Tanacetum coccineum TaxID=301880 RepID=A0ABQ5EGH5_9ASTR